MLGLLAFGMIVDYKAPYQEFIQVLSEVLVATKPLEIWPGTSGFELVVVDSEAGFLYAQAQRVAFQGAFNPKNPYADSLNFSVEFHGSLGEGRGLERIEPQITEWLSLVVRQEGDLVYLSWSAAASDDRTPVFAEAVMSQVVAELERRFPRD